MRRRGISSGALVEREADIQRRCEKLLDALGMRWLHVPGDIQRWLRLYAPKHICIIGARYLRGMPDLIVFSPSGRYLLLELKTEKGRLRKSQLEWSQGLPLHVARGWKEAEKIILSFAS